MFETNQQEPKLQEKKNFFETMIEIVGWLQIVASPLAFGLIAGGFIYFPNPTKTRLVVASLVVLAGLIIGIVWATRVWKRKGTMHYLSRTMATPELDEEEKIETK